MTFLWGTLSIVLASMLYIALRGAPYVPTKQRVIERLFEDFQFGSNDLLVDLGSGDGRVLLAAANRGIKSIGYELNPLLVAYSRWRTARYHQSTTIVAGDFWRSSLPRETTVVFVFLAGPFMDRLDKKLTQDAKQLGRNVTLISYGVPMNQKTPLRTTANFYIYRYKA